MAMATTSVESFITDEGTERDVCPSCGNDYQRIGTHWTMSSCEHPPISEYKKELLTGLLMGDGCIDGPEGGNSRMQVFNISIRFLEWLSDELGWLTTSISMKRTAEETARNARETLGRETSVEDAHDYYCLSIRTHPWFDTLRAWYGDGGKAFPTDLEPSPNLFKMWYVSDWCVHWNNANPSLQVDSANEQERPEAIENVLDTAGFEVTQSGKNFRLLTADTERFLDYIGDPVPGIEYKWEVDDRARYDSLKDEVGTNSSLDGGPQ